MLFVCDLKTLPGNPFKSVNLLLFWFVVLLRARNTNIKCEKQVKNHPKTSCGNRTTNRLFESAEEKMHSHFKYLCYTQR